MNPQKAVFFVQHIQQHLDNHETGGVLIKEGRQIPIGKVGCKICEKSIDQIWNDRKLKP